MFLLVDKLGTSSSLPPAEHLLNLLNVCYREDSVSQLLTRTLPQANSPGTAIPEFSHALDRLTESAGSLSSPFFSSVVYSASQRIELGRGVEGVGSEGGREPLPDKDLEIVLRVSCVNQSIHQPINHWITDVIFSHSIFSRMHLIQRQLHPQSKNHHRVQTSPVTMLLWCGG